MVALPHSLNVYDYPPQFQFGNGAPYTLESTACTDTVVRMIINYYMEKDVSIQNIRKAAGGPNDGVHGLTIAEALRALAAYGVTWYRQASNVSATFVLQKAYTGPVLIGVGYGQYPSLHGGICTQSNVALLGGKVDCSFKDAHAVLILGNTAVKDATGKVIRYDAFLRDPDHWNEKPKYDRITGSQLTKTMKALVTDTAWTGTFALYPTKKKVL